MKLLLDTHVLIWLAEGSDELALGSRRAIDAAAAKQGLVVSAISFWEVAMLEERRRISLSLPVTSWRRRVLETTSIVEQSVTGEIAIEAVVLPGELHSDPADRLLVATARVHALRPATRDARLIDYGRRSRRGARGVESIQCARASDDGMAPIEGRRGHGNPPAPPGVGLNREAGGRAAIPSRLAPREAITAVVSGPHARLGAAEGMRIAEELRLYVLRSTRLARRRIARRRPSSARPYRKTERANAIFPVDVLAALDRRLPWACVGICSARRPWSYGRPRMTADVDATVELPRPASRSSSARCNSKGSSCASATPTKILSGRTDRRCRRILRTRRYEIDLARVRSRVAEIEEALAQSDMMPLLERAIAEAAR